MNSTADNIFRLNTKNPEAIISIVDESLEMKSGIRCDLFSSISENEVSLAMLDRKQNKFLALEVFQRDLSGSVKHSEWLNEIPAKSIILKNYEFKSTTVAVVNELSTLVPSALFREEDTEKYFRFNFNSNHSHILSESIRAFDVVNVFALSSSLNESVYRLFDHPAIHHHTSSLLQGVHLAFRKSNEKMLLINIRSGYVDIVVTEGKKLIFTNSFAFKNNDDLVYYVMFVCDRLQLDTESVSTFILGEVERESAMYHMLYKYIRNLNFAPRPSVFDFSYVFKEIPAHFYFNLFSLALCES